MTSRTTQCGQSVALWHIWHLRYLRTKDILDRVQIYGLWVFCYFLWSQDVPLEDLPFDDSNLGEMFKKIATANIFYPNTFSKKLKDFLQRILNQNPAKRISFEQMVLDPWIKELPADVLESLQTEVTSYKKSPFSLYQKPKTELKFIDLSSFFISKLLLRTLDKHESLEIETFTSNLVSGVIVEKIGIIFGEEMTDNLHKCVDGPVTQIKGKFAGKDIFSMRITVMVIDAESSLCLVNFQFVSGSRSGFLASLKKHEKELLDLANK